ncbi:hypothetical protein VN12_04575 [Pirellula sp. SH-Sr6A]|uniref:hypothetical protein n=1 Tax=Pirellula sp. SH-Sr6A TaxID=1632865 RepID=UPI00078E73CB|nr:hypothetical protein [Pirellula sp. SH-Sr6A]AMV31369.1 hypothetical protein VN12_04575 [Pirellula sp. SH-Sr6A]
MDFHQRGDLWNGCQLLLTTSEPQQVYNPSFSGVVETIDDASDLNDAMDRLRGRRFAKIGVASPSISELIFDSRNAAESIRQMCSDQTFFAVQPIDPIESHLRKHLHSVGFYEIAEWHPNARLRIDCSTVSGLPDGQFELQSSKPGISIPSCPYVLIASRYALPMSIPSHWTLIGSPLRDHQNGGVTSNDDPEIGLAIRDQPETKSSVWTKLMVTGQICWETPALNGAFAALVGSYSGPGDSNMYAAMIDAYTDPFAQVSLWCCHRNWERIANTHFPLPHGKPSHSIHLALIIGLDTVELQIGNERVLWVYDARIPRTASYGMRLRGNQFTVQKLAAAVE